MSIIAWSALITLALIFIFLGSAFILYVTFFSNAGANKGLGIGLFLLSALIIAAFLPTYGQSPVYSAAIIAWFILVAGFSVLERILLPNFDNKDVIKAFRPIILFSIASGLLVAVFNLAKIAIV